MLPRSTRALVSVAHVLLLLAVLVSCGREKTDEDRGPVKTAAPTTQPATKPIAPSNEEWNPTQIDWQPFEAGLRRAGADHKPMCLVFYASWCPHCRNFSRVFDDPRVAARARDFVMVKVDSDAEPALSAKYARDGGYIPRTYFLSSDGTLEASIHAPRPRFQYFYDEQDPGSLLAGMDAAIAKLGK